MVCVHWQGDIGVGNWQEASAEAYVLQATNISKQNVALSWTAASVLACADRSTDVRLGPAASVVACANSSLLVRLCLLVSLLACT